MEREYIFEIEQLLISYDPEELLKWRKGDPTTVPPDVLSWKGPGRENGYGYAEHIVKRYLEKEGFEVVANQFNLFPVKKSKYARNNTIIADVLGKEGYERFQKALAITKENGIKIEMPDICVLRPEFHFIEVKRDTDKVRPPQVMFAALASAVLSTKFKICKVLPVGTIVDTPNILVKQELLSEIFLL